MNRIDKCLLKAIRKIVVTADADSLIALSRYPAIPLSRYRGNYANSGNQGLAKRRIRNMRPLRIAASSRLNDETSILNTQTAFNQHIEKSLRLRSAKTKVLKATLL
jgi:hypothetical protein